MMPVRSTGSSPRVRGTRRDTECLKYINRFIPAGAGNTVKPPDTYRPPTVHPRGCGEHPIALCARRAACGSSPRVRGTPERATSKFSVDRFIPAGAGNTASIRSQWRSATGSSPRVRGTHPLRTHRPDGRRFIPAGAGNTLIVISMLAAFTVHPRGCGEHAGGGPCSCANSGSSPRVRGTLFSCSAQIY